MYTRYFATHPALLGDLVWRELSEQVKDAKLTNHVDNGILFTSSKPSWQFKDIPYLQNIFVVAEIINKKLNLYDLTQRALASQELTRIVKQHTSPQDNFRIVVARGSHTNEYPEAMRIKLEENIKKYTNRGVSRTLPNFEIWLWNLADDVTILAVRITANADYQEYMPQGGLRQELAYLINTLAKPDATNLVWDPFCGSGSLAISRAMHWPYKQIYATDLTISRIEQFMADEHLHFKNFHVKANDFFKDSFLPTVDTIVTDPPWIMFNNPIQSQQLLERLRKCLRAEGRAVILAPRELNIENTGFTDIETYPTYVGGKKAVINLLKA